MEALKGIVIDTAHGLVKIQTETGTLFWIMPEHPLLIREHVRISWDYTNDMPLNVMSKAKFKELSQEPDDSGEEIFSITDSSKSSEYYDDIPDIEVTRFSRLPHNDDYEDELVEFDNYHNLT